MFTCLHAHNCSMCRSWPGSREALGVHGRKGIRVSLSAWYHEPDADKEKFRIGGKMQEDTLAVGLWVCLKGQQRAGVLNIPTLWVLRDSEAGTIPGSIPRRDMASEAQSSQSFYRSQHGGNRAESSESGNSHL